MTQTIPSPAEGAAIAIQWARGADWNGPAAARATASREGFSGKAGQILLAPDAAGGLERVVFGLGEGAAPSAMSVRVLGGGLPPGDYRIEDPAGVLDPGQIALAWALGAYRFDRYKKNRDDPPPRLLPPAGADMARSGALAQACALARDMINTPASDMGPRQVETLAREIAQANGAAITVTVGDALIEAGYPAVHAVGRAAAAERAPRMIEIAWGETGAPLVALIGNGVTFDSGGLDIKASAGMRLMKKDMGGAAHALALARMVMDARLPVRLAVLIPTVENAIGGDAMRPGDVLASRGGLSIE
ncbi:MAG: leucyl aminopeptidase family protein, partial [Caulobacteraceae bacterium]